jgi:hypothetical protein
MKDRLRTALEIRGKKAVDLSRDLEIPKSAISQYLSGHRIIKDSKRLFVIAEYLDVSEAWLMGFDVPMERIKKDDTQKDIVERNEMSESTKALIDFAKSVPEDKADLILRVMKSILEDS